MSIFPCRAALGGELELFHKSGREEAMSGASSSLQASSCKHSVSCRSRSALRSLRKESRASWTFNWVMFYATRCRCCSLAELGGPADRAPSQADRSEKNVLATFPRHMQ